MQTNVPTPGRWLAMQPGALDDAASTLGLDGMQQANACDASAANHGSLPTVCKLDVTHRRSTCAHTLTMGNTRHGHCTRHGISLTAKGGPRGTAQHI